MGKTTFELLEADKYYKSVLEQIPKARKRIVIAAMVVLWGERTGPIFAMLEDALKRGVKVTILLDNFTKLTSQLGLTPASSGRERLRQTFRTLEDLSAKGAKIHCFGKIGLVPYKGRCHIKATIIDDISYSFGGVNFNDEQFANVDYLLMSKDPKVADCLEELVGRICKTRPPLLDGEVPLDRHTKVLFDGGRPGHSLIYERACELTAQAKKVCFVSHFTPSGQLAKLLHETESRIYTCRPEQMLPMHSIAQAFDLQRYRITNSYTGDKIIHAKLMLFELPGGRKALLSGSHNFSYRGVAFGTQEIALHSKDPDLWDQFQRFVQRRLA